VEDVAVVAVPLVVPLELDELVGEVGDGVGVWV
jgi:hypothetical protein